MEKIAPVAEPAEQDRVAGDTTADLPVSSRFAAMVS